MIRPARPTLAEVPLDDLSLDREGYWWAGMGPVDGPVLGPFRSRTEALGAERGWLVGQIVETASNQRLPGTAPDASVLLAAFEANRCRSGLAYR